MVDRKRWRRAQNFVYVIRRTNAVVMVTSLRLRRRRRSERRKDRLTVRNVRRHDDCNMKRVVCREPFDEPAGADRRWSTSFTDLASLHDQVRWRVTVACEKHIVDCRARRHRTGKGSRCVVGGAMDLYGLLAWTFASIYVPVYFSLDFGRRLPTVWHILVRMGNEAVRSWAAKTCGYIAN